uniref:DJ-1/PfpI domain-containing protein n=1 Tax=Hemiselmis andersenii TaxID=464988 RepID=A0A6T8P1C5_HEMAN|mmetsp:Transcript_45190/g.110217  ORF Transcript_45190/g.110217 Transcript_45190/m.110217 type:complete len:180 (+) Transcript_45190:65-604(+)
MVKALVILPDGFEEIESVCPIDILRRAEVEVTVASLSSSLNVKGRSNITLACDVLLESVKSETYDLLVLPGGPGTKAVREDARAIEMTKRHCAEGKKVGAICAAPTVLKEAGVLPAKYTAHFSVAGDLPNILPDKVVVDGNIITSTGAGTAIEFGLAMAAAVCGQEKSDGVAKAIEFKK